MSDTRSAASRPPAGEGASSRHRPTRPGLRPFAARLSVVTLVLFLLATVAEHLLDPNLNPLTHQVSEYARSSATGWVMTAGFMAWAVSLLLAAFAVGGLPNANLSRRALAALLAAAASGVVLLTVFHTQTSAGRLPPRVHLSTGGRLHDVGSGLTSVALWGAAVCAGALPPLPRWLRRWSLALAALTVLCDVGLLLAGTSVGGLRQRVLIGAGCLWLILLDVNLFDGLCDD
jgi:hypothetical protein